MMINWIVLFITLYLTVYYLLLVFEKRERKTRGEKEPELTIAVPAYNEEENILKTLESIYGVDYPKEKLHVIVVDDGSTDATYRIAREFARTHRDIDIKVLRHRKNRGKAAALNTALAHTTTPFFVTVDADSFIDRKALKNLLKRAGGNAVVAGCVFPEKTSKIPEKLQELEYLMGNYLAYVLRKFDAQTVAPGPLSLYRTSCLREVGGFDESCPAEDLEVVIRLRKRGHAVDFAPDARVYTRVPSDFKGVVNQRRRWRLGTYDAIGKHPRFILPLSVFSEQIFAVVIFSFSVLLLFFLTLYYLYKRIDSLYIFLKAVGLDIFPYLKNLEFRIDLLSFDPQTMFYSAVGVFLTLFATYLTLRFFEDRKVSWKDVLFYLLLYPGALIMAHLLALKDWIRREYRW